MNPRCALSWLYALGACLGLQTSTAWADTPPSASISGGYFLGYSTNVFLSSESSAKDLADIQRVCAGNGPLWVLGRTQRFECTRANDVTNTHGNVLELQIKARKPLGNLAHALLYSVRPFTAPSWTVRPLIGTDLSVLRNEMPQKFKKYNAVFNQNRLKNALVIEPKNSLSKFYVLPWKTTDDGYVERKYFIIATMLRGSITSVREHEGKVVAYADLDGDSVPELHLSHHCDGTCDSVISMTRETKSTTVIEISMH